MEDENDDIKINSNISYSPVWINTTDYNTTSNNTITYTQPTYTYTGSGSVTTYNYPNHYIGQMKTYYDSYQTTVTPRKEVEFEDYYPAITKVQDMCKEYPALEKAWEQFKLTYRLTVSDYDAQKDDV